MEEESIRDNFVVIYELLDEVMDFGWPQVTETKILKEFIMQVGNKLERAQPSLPPQAVRCGLVAAPVSAGIRRYPPVSCHTHLAPVPAQLTNRVSWRPEGIKHRKNEIFLDVVERLNLLVSTSGSVLHSEIVGAIKMKSFLSGMPELKLGLNDKVLFQATGRRSKGKAVEMEDIKFHQCVRLARFENDRTISFIPPDGEFTLMTYRLNTHVRALRAAPLLPHSLGQGLSRRLVSQVKPLIWVESVVEPHKNSRIEYLVKAKSQFKSRSIANNVEIIIPVPPDVDSPAFKVRCPAWFYLSTWCVLTPLHLHQASIGTVTYVPDKDAIVWSIKQFYGSREYRMRAHFGLPSVASEETSEGKDNWKKPIGVRFEIPYFTVSGIQVRYLKIIEKSGYLALPWVRYITQAGEYRLRMN